MINYYFRQEISNSDLSEVYRHFYGGLSFNSDEGLRFGTLFDAIVTEPSKIDFLNLRIEDYQYTREEFNRAEEMKASLDKEYSISSLISISEFQVVKTSKFNVGGVDLPVRCKYDGFTPAGFGWDLKSTAAKTMSEFLKHCETFHYPRARAFYMDISGAKKDLIIGVSKYKVMGKHSVFPVFIDQNHRFYKDGKSEYLDLCEKLIILTKAA